VNDETLGVVEIQGMFLMIENTIQLQQQSKYTENHTFKAGVNFIRGNHQLFEVETSR
jgi:hypothetical protein